MRIKILNSNLLSWAGAWSLLVATALAAGSLRVRAQELKPERAKADIDKAQVMHASASESIEEASLRPYGIICNHASRSSKTLVVNEVRLGTAGAYSGISAGDIIKKVEKSPSGGLYVTIARGAQVYRAELAEKSGEVGKVNASSAASTALQPRQPELGANTNQNFIALAQEHHKAASSLSQSDITGRFTDLWIARFYDPTDETIVSELKNVQEQIESRARSNGASWHIVEYFRPQPNRPADVRHLLNGGVRLYAIGDNRNARRLFEEVLKVEPKNTDALFNLGALNENERNTQEACKFYHQVAQIDPSDPEVQVAERNVGEVPVLSEGGLVGDVTETRRSFRGLKSSPGGTCSTCRIFRDGYMDAH